MSITLHKRTGNLPKKSSKCHIERKTGRNHKPVGTRRLKIMSTSVLESKSKNTDVNTSDSFMEEIRDFGRMTRSKLNLTSAKMNDSIRSYRANENNHRH